MKKVMSLLIAAAMLAAALPAASLAEEEDDALIFSASFDGGVEAEIGGITVKGSISAAEGHNGNAAVFDNNPNNYLMLTDKDGSNNLFVGKNAITVTFFEKRTSGTWPIFTAPNTNSQDYLKSENYIALFDNGGTFKIERYVGTRNSENSSSAIAGSYPSSDENGWRHVAMVLTDEKSELYVDGLLAASSVSASPLSSLFAEESYIQIGRGNWGSESFGGMIDEIKIYAKELSASEIIAAAGITAEDMLNKIELDFSERLTQNVELPQTEAYGNAITWTSSDESVITAAGEITRGVHDADAVLTAAVTFNGETKTRDFPLTVKGLPSAENFLNEIDLRVEGAVMDSIYLPSEIEGTPVEWASSDESAITSKDAANGDYTIPAGYVTRGDTDVPVTLTATITYDGETKSKDFGLTVKARNYERENEEKVAYLYAYFKGNVNGKPEVQQIHVATSEDGYKWTDLNGNWPILTSSMGTKNLRDPYIIRSRYGDKFYLLATDLNCQDGQGWGPWSLAGSKYLMVWESEDLVNWSEQRMVKFANDDIGCAWAPESIYDEDTGEYIVYAAGKDLAYRRETGREVDTMFVVRTRDFKSFSEPEIFFIPTDDSGNRTAAIDSSIIHADDGKYYHFYKHNSSQVRMMVSEHAAGPYTPVSAFSPIGGEGPAIYKVNNSDQYCLCIDNYSVYVPYLTDNISSGVFTKGTDDVIMPTGSKHGVMVPVTKSEYEGLLKAYGPREVDPEGSDAVLSYDFEAETEGLNGNAVIENDPEKGNVLTLDGSEGTYFEFPENTFERRDTFTLSMDVKSNMTGGNYFTFGLGSDSEHYMLLKDGSDSLRLSMTITGYQYEETASSAATVPAGEWAHFDLAVRPGRLAIYRNGALIAENSSVVRTVSHLGVDKLNAYLGKSIIDGDLYFNGSFDNVKLYNRALTDAEIAEAFGLDDSQSVAEDPKYVAFGQNIDSVRGNLTLPSEGVYGSSIIWESSKPEVIALDGTVTRPAIGEEDAYVVLTGTFTKGESVNVVKYNVTVKAQTEDWISKASFDDCYSFAPQTGVAYFNFDITPSQMTDGVMGFCASSFTPNTWANYNIAVRVQPGGYFDAHNGTGYAYTNYVAYEANKTYHATIKADISAQTFSFWITDEAGNISLVADNFSFRNKTGSDLSKVNVRGGNGIAAGLFTVSSFSASGSQLVPVNAEVKESEASEAVLTVANFGDTISVDLYAACYDGEGSLIAVKKVPVEIDNCQTATVTSGVPEGCQYVKLIAWEAQSVTPLTEAIKKSAVKFN